MAIVKIIDPVSRIEGHLKAEVTISNRTVVDARLSGTLFRGFENILINRVPDDAPMISQRICGVCPVSHAQASVLALENIQKWKPTNNARILRNLILGANFIQSHILHFYLLSLVDYVPGPSVAPWSSYWDVDMRPGLKYIMDHLNDALAARRKADEMSAVFGAKIPHAASYISGGMTPEITAAKVEMFKQYLSELAGFINNIFIPDVQAVASVYTDYFGIGAGYENLLAFGAFENADGSKFFKPGILRKNQVTPSPIDTSRIQEHVTKSWYKDAAPAGPANAVTVATYPKTNAYSWTKAPRYENEPFEAGGLARMKISGNYSGGVSTLDRFIARSQEAALLVQAMRSWVEQLSLGSAYDDSFNHAYGYGEGLTEAPRGALGHWVKIGSNGTVAQYQVVTPTCWNSSPEDDAGKKGPIERALIGIKVIDETRPIEVLRVIHSFDPCQACAVHVLRPKGKTVVIAQR